MSTSLRSESAASDALQDILDAVRRGLASTSADVRCTHEADGALLARISSTRPGPLGIEMWADESTVEVSFESWPDVLGFEITDERECAELVNLLDSVFHGRVSLRVKSILGFGAGRVVSVNVGAAGHVGVKYRPLHSSAFVQVLGRVQTLQFEPYSYALPTRVIRPI